MMRVANWRQLEPVLNVLFRYEKVPLLTRWSWQGADALEGFEQFWIEMMPLQ